MYLEAEFTMTPQLFASVSLLFRKSLKKKNVKIFLFIAEKNSPGLLKHRAELVREEMVLVQSVFGQHGRRIWGRKEI